MIRIENAEIGMRVLIPGFGEGELINLRCGDLPRVYGEVKLDDGSFIDRPLDGMVSLSIKGRE